MITIREPMDTSYPPTPARNRVAITCMMAVPSMLMVMPRGSTKEATSRSTPMSVILVSVFRGRVAALELVEKPNTTTLKIFFTKVMGLSLQVKAM